jgi:hypothetical protein
MPQPVNRHFHRCPHKKCDAIYPCALAHCNRSDMAYRVCEACWETIHRLAERSELKEKLQPQA